jgi:hypothetical protein
VIRFLEGDRRQDVGLGTEILVYDAATARNASKVVALSTCADAQTNGRLVVFGRLEKRVEAEPNPTEEPETTASPEEPGVQRVRLIVHFVADGAEVFPTEVFVHRVGDRYYITVPQLAGYVADTELLHGTITENMEITIVYRAKVNTLTIRYRLTDGTEIRAPYRQTVKTGEKYDIISPVIPGYKASMLRVAGTNHGRDEEYTVLYIPEDWVIITEPDTPLYAGETQIQIGICEE